MLENGNMTSAERTFKFPCSFDALACIQRIKINGQTNIDFFCVLLYYIFQVKKKGS